MDAGSIPDGGTKQSIRSMDCFQGVIEQSHRKRGDKMSRARQGGLRPNRRHVQRGSDMISFVLDVGGKIQSAFPRFFHQPPIPGRWQPCRTVGRNPAVALVAQLDRASDHGSGGCGFESHREHEIHTNTSTSLFLRVDQWSSGRAVECDCPESSRGASPRRFESSLLREPRMKIVPMRGLSRFGRCAPY